MATELYRIGEQSAPPRTHHKRRWLIIFFITVAILAGGYLWARSYFKPDTVIKQSHAVITKVDANSKTKHFDEPDFGIDLPIGWVQLPRPAGPYQSFTWSNGATNGDEAEFEVFEDTIPPNFQVNRMQVVQGEGDHVEIEGVLSDDCTTFTRDLAITNGEYGVQAKWQNVSFICDRSNTSRDVLGTSSKDGINIVNLKTISTGVTHKFFFTFTNHSLNPDYSVFNSTITSLHMK